MFDRRDEQNYLDIFADQVRHNVQGLCVTRQSPVKIRQRLGLEKTPMIWLVASDGVTGENCIKPDNLSGLGVTLSKFLNEADNGFILIDGLEYLIARNSFETVLKFVHFLNDKTMISKCSILIVLDPLFDRRATVPPIDQRDHAIQKFLSSRSLEKGTMNPKKCTKDVSHQEHQGHQEAPGLFSIASGGHAGGIYKKESVARPPEALTKPSW